MNQDTLNIILSAIAAFGGIAAATAGVATIWLAIRHNRQRRAEREEDRRLAQEQLGLAREEALRHPRLEVVGVSLIDAEKDEDVIRTRGAKGKWEKALEIAREEVKDKPATSTFGFSFEAESLAAKSMGNYYSMYQIEYDGPYPNFVVKFELRNQGRKPAQDVSGRVTFDSVFLEPIEFPKMDGDEPEGIDIASILDPTSGKSMKLDVGTVPPYPSEKKFTFKIALLKKRTGKTNLVAVFSTPDGDYLEESTSLEIP